MFDDPFDTLAALPGAGGDIVRENLANPPLAGEMPQDTASRVVTTQRVQQQAQQAVNRWKAGDLAERKIPSFTDQTGNVQAVPDETGAPIVNYDKTHNVGWNSKGAPVSVSYDSVDGPPVVKDAFAGVPLTTDAKTGDQYQIHPGLPWQYVGKDEGVAQQALEKEKDKAVAGLASALGRKVTLDERQMKRDEVEFKHRSEDLMNTYGLSKDDSLEAKKQKIDASFKAKYDAPDANEKTGILGFGAMTDKAMARRAEIDQEHALALAKLDGINVTDQALKGRRSRMDRQRLAQEGLSSQIVDRDIAKATGSGADLPSAFAEAVQPQRPAAGSPAAAFSAPASASTNPAAPADDAGGATPPPAPLDPATGQPVPQQQVPPAPEQAGFLSSAGAAIRKTMYDTAASATDAAATAANLTGSKDTAFLPDNQGELDAANKRLAELKDAGFARSKNQSVWQHFTGGLMGEMHGLTPAEQSEQAKLVTKINRLTVNPGWDAAVKNLQKEGKNSYAAYDISPDADNPLAKMGRGAGAFLAIAPTMAAGLAPAVAQMAGNAYEQKYAEVEERASKVEGADPDVVHQVAQRAAMAEAVKQAPQLLAYTVGGKLASAAVGKLMPAAGALARGIAGGAAATAANMAVGAGTRALEAEPGQRLAAAAPTLEGATQDALFGFGVHGLAEAANAPATNPAPQAPPNLGPAPAGPQPSTGPAGPQPPPRSAAAPPPAGGPQQPPPPSAGPRAGGPAPQPGPAPAPEPTRTAGGREIPKAQMPPKFSTQEEFNAWMNDAAARGDVEGATRAVAEENQRRSDSQTRNPGVKVPNRVATWLKNAKDNAASRRLGESIQSGRNSNLGHAEWLDSLDEEAAAGVHGGSQEVPPPASAGTGGRPRGATDSAGTDARGAHSGGVPEGRGVAATDSAAPSEPAQSPRSPDASATPQSSSTPSPKEGSGPARGQSPSGATSSEASPRSLSRPQTGSPSTASSPEGPAVRPIESATAVQSASPPTETAVGQAPETQSPEPSRIEGTSPSSNQNVRDEPQTPPLERDSNPSSSSEPATPEPPAQAVVHDRDVDTGAKLRDFLARAAQRSADDAGAQAMLDHMEENDISPTKVVEKFWSETHPNLPPPVQRKFQRMIQSVTGLKPGDVVATKKGPDGTVESLKAKDWSEVFPPEATSSNARDLEGTERGLLVLMHLANEGAGKMKEATPVQPRAFLPHETGTTPPKPEKEPAPALHPEGTGADAGKGENDADAPGVRAPAEGGAERARATKETLRAGFADSGIKWRERTPEEKAQENHPAMGMDPETGEVLVNTEKMHEWQDEVARSGHDPAKYMESVIKEEDDHARSHIATVATQGEFGPFQVKIWRAAPAAVKHALMDSYGQLQHEMHGGVELESRAQAVFEKRPIAEDFHPDPEVREAAQRMRAAIEAWDLPDFFRKHLAAMSRVTDGKLPVETPVAPVTPAKPVKQPKQQRPPATGPPKQSKASADLIKEGQDFFDSLGAQTPWKAPVRGGTMTAPAPRILSTAQTDVLRSVYRSLVARTGFPAVKISDLAKQSGIPMGQLKEYLTAEHKKGNLVLSIGDWSLSTPDERAGVIDLPSVGRALQVRLLPQMMGAASPQAGYDPMKVAQALLDADTPIVADLSDAKGFPDAETVVVADKTGVHWYDLTGKEPTLMATAKATGDQEAIAALSDGTIPKVRNLDDLDHEDVRADFPDADKALVINPMVGRMELYGEAEDPIATAWLQFDGSFGTANPQGKASRYFPPEALQGAVQLAQKLVGEGITTPLALAQYINAMGEKKEKAKPFTQALWNIMGGFQEHEEAKPDWPRVFGEAEKPEEAKPVANEGKLSSTTTNDDRRTPSQVAGQSAASNVERGNREGGAGGAQPTGDARVRALPSSPNGLPPAPADERDAVQAAIEQFHSTPRGPWRFRRPEEPLETAWLELPSGTVVYDAPELAKYRQVLGDGWLTKVMQEENAHRRDFLASAMVGQGSMGYIQARAWRDAPDAVREAFPALYGGAGGEVSSGAEIIRMIVQLAEQGAISESTLRWKQEATSAMEKALSEWDLPDWLQSHLDRIHHLTGAEPMTGEGPAQTLGAAKPTLGGGKQTDSPAFRAWFGDSKVVDKDGRPLVVYHGSKRADRIGNRFQKKRATSGPMAFFTTNPDIASGYATGKNDTSLEHPDDYAGWFKFKGKGMRSPVDIDRAWWSLSPEERATITSRIPTIGHENPDEAEGPIVGNSKSIMGRDSIDYELRQARGNGLRALVEIWLNSGSLIDNEAEFMDVLKAAGMDMGKVTYENPWESRSGVFPVYLAIEHPLNTGAIPPTVMAELESAGKRRRAKLAAGGNPDAWDKNSVSGSDWLATLRDDIKNDTTHAWTRIPDWVTERLTQLGYDGIQDVGGKYGGDAHGVWIPFRETQVKSATGNSGKFDPSNPSILGAANPLRRAIDAIAQEVAAARDTIKTAPTRDRVKFGYDATGNHANIMGEQAKNAIAHDFHRPRTGGETRKQRKAREARIVRDMLAARFVVEAGGDRIELARQRRLIETGKDPKLSAKFLPILDHAAANFDELDRKSTGHRQLAEKTFNDLIASGEDFGQRKNYVHRVTVPPVDPDGWNPLFGMGSGHPKSPRDMEKGRSFVSMADAIHAGYNPGTYGIHEADQRMVENAYRIIGGKAFLEEMRRTLSPTDGHPVLGRLVAKQKASGEWEMEVPDGYKSITANGQPLIVHEAFADLFSNLFGTSMVRAHAAGRLLMKAEAVAKHGTLVLDTFHVGRLLYKMATGGGGLPITFRGGTPAFNYHKGLSAIEYNDAELADAVTNREITQSEADYVRSIRPKFDRLVKAGLNVGKVADNLLEQAQMHIPVLSGINDWIFRKLSRGAMVQTAISFLDRNDKKMPAAEAARQTAKEMNEYFGNLQSQGLFQNKSLQDLTRIVFLAPNWTESQFRYEGRAYGQAVKAPIDLARGRGVRLGNVTRAFAAGFVALLAANQVINYLSRGHSTFENPEEDRFLDAFIPGGRRGFFFNPLEIAGEFAHAAMKYAAQHENPVDIATHIAGNKLSPVGRGVKAAATGRDASGRHFLSERDRFTSAATEVMPMPLPLGAAFERDPRQPLGFRRTRAPGSLEKQALQSVGLKVTAAPSPRSQMFALAHPFRADGGKTDAAGEYTELRRALDNGDDDSARSEILWLTGKQGKYLEQIGRALGIKKDGSISPERFTGGDDREKQMLKSLNPEQKAIYQEAQADHRANALRFKALQATLPAIPSKPHPYHGKTKFAGFSN